LPKGLLLFPNVLLFPKGLLFPKEFGVVNFLPKLVPPPPKPVFPNGDNRSL